ncbi:MAG: DUF6049 family protein [Nocardioides sp.]|nr:DUF6049 family protein [Nocardioides sp.]
MTSRRLRRPNPRRPLRCLAVGVVTGLLATAAAVGVGPATASHSAAPPVADVQPPVAGPAPDPTPPEDPTGEDAAEEEVAPLEVTLDDVTPSTLRARGTVTVRGTVTNVSEERWQDLNVHLLTSASPMTTAAELTEAAQSSAGSSIGGAGRLTGDGQFDSVGDLSPGASTPFVVRVPRAALQLSGEPGVYWLAVHVLGTNRTGRDGIADGRARTFLPLVPPTGRQQPGRRPVDTALVVPLREQVQRLSSGALTDPLRWAGLVEEDGRLDRLLTMAQSASDLPLTWAVDPAVLEAIGSLAAGNPTYDLGPTTGAGDGSAEPSPTTGGTTEPDPEEEPSAEQADAQGWLTEFVTAAEDARVMALPYGDVDAASLWRNNQVPLLEQAYEESATVLGDLGLDARSLLDPPSGLLPPGAVGELAGLESAPLLMLDDAAAPDAPSGTARTADGSRVLLADAAAGDGGPGPAPAHTPLAVRQRVLAEAALRLDGVGAASEVRGGPLVVGLPDAWDPGPAAADVLVEGLDVPWLRVVPLTTVATDRGRDAVLEEPLVYPHRERRRELPARNVDAALDLVTQGATLEGLLAENDTIGNLLARTALLTVSSAARGTARNAVSLARGSIAAVERRLGQVRIEGPDFVTMSSGEGFFAVTVVNDLDQPIEVVVVPGTDDEALTITPPDPLTLNAGARASLRLAARSTGFGVSGVTLTPATVDGAPLPTTTQINVRRSQVGVVIWVVMGVGAGVLVVALVLRIVRGRRSRRAERAAATPDGTPV